MGCVVARWPLSLVDIGSRPVAMQPLRPKSRSGTCPRQRAAHSPPSLTQGKLACRGQMCSTEPTGWAAMQ